MSTPGTLHALLIGIDCYLPNRLPDGSYYPSLGGCVRDVARVEERLVTTLGMTPDRILKLTATDAGRPEPPEPREAWPTYQNIVAAFQALTDRAQPGDLVYVHYSGHGGRVPTAYPALKGGGALDETLVPTDIGHSDARHLRDLELAALLQRMVRKGLVVTVTLDSCHSGGATRAIAVGRPRGISSVDTTQRPASLLSEDDLRAAWTATGARGLVPGNSRLPEPRGTVILAACRPSESANEYPFDGQWSGALTHWLLDALADLRPGLSYRMVYDRLLARIHSQFADQTPLLQGDADRAVFGSDHVTSRSSVLVLAVGEDGRVLLGAGQSQGVRKGARFVVYPLGTSDFEDAEKRLMLVETTELGATESWAAVVERYGGAPPAPGAPAVLFGAASLPLVKRVRLVEREGLPAQFAQRAALEAVAGTLSGGGWVERAAEGAAADYHVHLDDDGAYVIADAEGAPFPNLRPALRPGESRAADRVHARLIHLARYHAVASLLNADATSPLAGRLHVAWLGVQDDYDPVDPPAPRPFPATGAPPQIFTGQWIVLRIHNASRKVLNITALDLGPGFHIQQVYPGEENVFFEPLDPGEERVIPFPASLPEGYVEGTDRLKVFATVGASNFRVLELPELDETISRSVTRGAAMDPLTQLLEAVSAELPATRDLTPAARPTHQWTVAQVEVHIKRR